MWKKRKVANSRPCTFLHLQEFEAKQQVYGCRKKWSVMEKHWIAVATQ
jgi:hypothetical protein